MTSVEMTVDSNMNNMSNQKGVSNMADFFCALSYLLAEVESVYQYTKNRVL